MTSWRVTASNSATPLPLQAANMVRPANLSDAERVMKAAASDGRTVAFLGGGTEIGFGNPPERVDTLVRTDRLNGIVEYVPSDLIVTVEAGVTLADLQSTLAPHGQRLALDPPLPERATLGGLLATNAFGPRRARFGTLRDLIVGISFVRADGTRVRGGGKVVKNVAGFDLPKLMVGALGTLGLIATATFRLHPLPEASRWLRVVIPSASALREFCAAVRERKLEPSALVAFSTGHTFEACVLFEGFEAGVDEQSAALAAVASERKFPVDEASGDTVPQADESARQHGTLRLRLSAAPSDLELLCDVALAPLVDHLNNCRIVIYPTLGTAFVSAERGASDEDAALVRAIRDARATLEARGGSLVILELGPPAFAEPLDRFGTLPDAFFLMQRLKERFDPDRRLNRGRFLGGL